MGYMSIISKIQIQVNQTEFEWDTEGPCLIKICCWLIKFCCENSFLIWWFQVQDSDLYMYQETSTVLFWCLTFLFLQVQEEPEQFGSVSCSKTRQASDISIETGQPSAWGQRSASNSGSLSRATRSWPKQKLETHWPFSLFSGSRLHKPH